jgi:hypothetical protein
MQVKHFFVGVSAYVSVGQAVDITQLSKDVR